MFKKKEGYKPKVSGKRKIIVFVMLGLFVLGSYLNQDGDGYNYRIDGSDAQKFMIELADETRRSFSSGDTDARKKWHGLGLQRSYATQVYSMPQGYRKIG